MKQLICKQGDNKRSIVLVNNRSDQTMLHSTYICFTILFDMQHVRFVGSILNHNHIVHLGRSLIPESVEITNLLKPIYSNFQERYCNANG